MPYKVDSSLPNAAASGTNYEALSGTATIDAGESGVFVPLKTLDDKVAGWTKAVKVDVQDGGGQYVFDPIQNTATDEIVDSDLSIKLGDNSENQVIQGSSDGTQNLVEAKLDFPKEAKSGATVTLSENSASHADIWANANPKPGDKPLLAAGDGSVTLPIDKMPRHVWVGAIGASAAVGDFGLLLADAELGAADAAAPASAPVLPTSNQATTKPASVITVKITTLNDPNGTGKSDWTDQTQNWLVGQMVDLMAEVDGPTVLTEYAGFNWTVGGNTLRDYIIDGNSARTVPLSADDNGNGNSDATPTGTARQEIKFFWLGDSGNKDVKLAVDGVGSAEITKSTKFDVVEPSWAGTGTEGTPTIVKLKDGTALLALYGVPGIEGGKVGIRFSATVSTPDGFENGQFGFFQTWISHDRNTIVLPSGRTVTLKTRHEGETGADGQIPYLGQSWAADGSEHSAQDTPKHSLRKEDTSTTLDGHWITTLMFKPVGDAVWIPLAKLDWTTQITATNDGKGPNWRVQSNSQTINGVAGPSSSSFVREMNEPVWSVVLTPDDRMVLAD